MFTQLSFFDSLCFISRFVYMLIAFLLFGFQKDAKGEDVFSFVCKEIDLVEKDYFGLRFVDNNKQRVSPFCFFSNYLL